MRKRRWWIRIPLGVLCLVLTGFAALILDHGRPNLSIGRDLADLTQEEQIAVLALTDHVQRYPWKVGDGTNPGLFALYQGEAGNQDETGRTPIATACVQQNARLLGKLKRVLDDAGYPAAQPLCNAEHGFAMWKDNRGSYYVGSGYGGVYKPVRLGDTVMIWKTGDWIE